MGYYIGLEVAVASAGVPIGVIGIFTQGACVCASVRGVGMLDGWIAHIGMYARRTCADSG